MCVFCDIIDHKIPSKVVYEDDKVLAILDLSQATYGHTLVMPKKHYANVLECDPDTFADVCKVAQKLAKQIVEKTGAKGCNLLINTGEVAGQSVQHLHVHILPRYTEDDVTIQFHPAEGEKDLDAVLKTIKG